MFIITAILTGLLAGCIHVVTGPDHLAAVAPLATDGQRRAWRTGVLWGVGHSAGTWLLAGLALLFREALNVDAISTWSERIVGAVLIGIGLWGLHRVLVRGIHTHRHDHAGHDHTHAKGALGVGTLHGLAGTSHLLGVLPALALPTRSGALAYAVAFGLGSIVAMAAFATIVGLIAARAGRVSPRAIRNFMAAAAGLTLVVGVYWIYIGFGGGHEA